MADPLSTSFENYGEKIVSKTDKQKGAFVPIASQCEAIRAAGILPATSRPAEEFLVTVLNEPFQSIGASFYHAERKTSLNRTPEPRIGHAFISSSWLNVGDRVAIGNVGTELFAFKVDATATTQETVELEIARKASDATVLKRARMAQGKPAKRVIQRIDFVRNPFVVAAANIRSRGKCEMPKCQNSLFERDDGKPYLEVHHVVPLGENGDDTLSNVAALCPHCHRELHFGKERIALRSRLSKHIASLK